MKKIFSFANIYYALEVDFFRKTIASYSVFGKQLIGKNKLPLFSALLRGKDLSETILTANDCNFIKIQKEGGTVSTHYQSKQFPQLSFVVTLITSADSPKAKWKIEVQNQTDRLIEWLNFPQIAIINDIDGSQNCGRLLWPYNEGVLVNDTAARNKCNFKYEEPSYPSKGSYGVFPNMVQSQFIAYLSDGGGLYIGLHDPARNVKAIDWFDSKEKSLTIFLRLYTGIDFGANYAMDYFIEFTAFEGNDWQDAAAIYREWLEKNVFDLIPIGKNQELPEWYKDSPIVVTYPVRGRHDMDEPFDNLLFPYINAMPVVEEFAQKTNSRILVLLMHWEGTAPWAPPIVWPPHGGELALKEFIDALHQKQHVLGVYCSGLGWTEQSNIVKSYDMRDQYKALGVDKITCTSPSQTNDYSNICNAQRIGYDLCPACQKTKDMIFGQVKNMVNAGIDYIQLLDQNHGGNSYFCHSQTHGHPPCPGQWQIDEMKKLLRSIREINKSAVFGCESAAAEPYINDLRFSDNRSELNWFFGQSVPLYSFLYHEYVNNFMGNQIGCAFIPEDGRNYFYRVAYSFVAGDMSTIVITETGHIMQLWGGLDFTSFENLRDEYLTFIGGLNSWRKGKAKKYLLSGKMEKPFFITPEEKSYLTVWTNNKDTQIALPKVLSSRWSSKDGGCAQFFVNFNKESAEFTFVYDGKIKLYQNAADYDNQVFSTAKQIKVPPLSSVLVEILN